MLISLEFTENEIYVKIKIWVYKLENLILDNINSSTNENETSKSISKNFFSDIFYKVKTKIEKFKLKIIVYKRKMEQRTF